MITGFVNASREAIIEVLVRGPNQQEYKIEAIIDTGFNGSISLPPRIVDSLDLPFRRRGRAILANGGETIFDIYETIVTWDGQSRRVVVDEADPDPLVGMEVLHGAEMKVQAIEDGDVIII